MAYSRQDLGTLYNAVTTGTIIKGTINANSNIRIDGILEGDLHCSGRVVVGETGRIRGNVECQNAELLGGIEGNILVHDTLALRSTAKFQGEVTTKILIVEPNAKFNGTCKMK